MDHWEISMEANDASWRERCIERIEILKHTQFSSSDSASQLLQEKLSVEKKFLSHELYLSVQNKDADQFVDQLENIAAERRLSFSDIFNQVTRAGDSLLHVAARFGADNIAELICIHFPELLTKTNIKGDTALHVAARAKNSNAVQLILFQYAESRHKGVAVSSSEQEDNELTRMANEYGDTPLHEAVYSDDNFAAVSLLLEADKSVARRLNNSGKSPLYIAVQTCKRRADVINVLLVASFVDNPLPSSHHGISPLHAAISERNLDLLKHILATNIQVMYLRDEGGGTPLHCAASNGYLNGVRELLHRSTQLALEWDNDGHLPIHLACKMGHVDVVDEFVKQKWPNVRDMLTSEGQTIFHIAVENQQYILFRYLILDKDRFEKSLINEKDKKGNTALHLASMQPNPEILRLLSNNVRVDLNIKNNDDLTAEDIARVQGIALLPIPEEPKLRSDDVLFWARRRRTKSTRVPLRNEATRREFRQRRRLQNTQWINDRVNTNIIVAVLIATVTFAAGFTVPGSVYNSDEPGSKFGAMKHGYFIFDMERVVHEGLFLFGICAVGLALLTMSPAFMAVARLVVSNIPWLADLTTIIGTFGILFIALTYLVSFVFVAYRF